MIKKVVLCLFLLIPMAISVQKTHARKTVAFFVHGMNESGERQIAPMLPKEDGSPYLLHMPYETFDFSCSTDSWWRMNFWNCCLAQEDELEQMDVALAAARQKHPGAQFVLVGVSRGASAIINYCANYPTDDVAACLLEAPYDHILSLVNHHYRLKKLGRYAIPLFKRLFFNCDLEGMFPINQIDKIERDIPMLFVSVEHDRSIPLTSVKALIEKRKQSGHKNVSHLHLQQGRHGKLMSGADAHLYQAYAHSFFARYNLPHNPACVAERVAS